MDENIKTEIQSATFERLLKHLNVLTIFQMLQIEFLFLYFHP